MTDDQHVKWGQFITLLACLICVWRLCLSSRVFIWNEWSMQRRKQKFGQSMWGNLHLLMSPTWCTREINVMPICRVGYVVGSWLRHCATNWKDAGSIPDEIFLWHNPSDRTMALGSTQPLIQIFPNCAPRSSKCSAKHLQVLRKEIGKKNKINVTNLKIVNLCRHDLCTGRYWAEII